MNENERAMTFQFAAAAGDHTDDIALDRCADCMVLCLSDVELDERGRMLELSVRLKNVCPGKRVALGVILNELDEGGNEYARGMRAVTVPAHNESCGCDVLVRGIRFVLPEDLCSSSDGNRRFTARTTVHYVDLDEAQGCACRR